MSRESLDDVGQNVIALDNRRVYAIPVSDSRDELPRDQRRTLSSSSSTLYGHVTCQFSSRQSTWCSSTLDRAQSTTPDKRTGLGSC